VVSAALADVREDGSGGDCDGEDERAHGALIGRSAAHR
jgi:hypothetical protein